MYISCSTKRKVLEIPNQGTAVLAGYWSPESCLDLGPFLLKWREGKVDSLEPLEPLGRLEKEIYRWDSYILMPGYLDAHVHLALDSVDFYQCLKNWEEPSLIENQMNEFLTRYLKRGIVAIRDGGDVPGYAWLAKNRVKEQAWLGPNVVSVHEAVARKGFYGRFLGRSFKDVQDWRMQERGFFTQGMDQFKVIVTGIIRFEQYGVVGPTQWTVGELRTLVDIAHEYGKRVMAHASGEEGISVAIAAGVDSIEHGYYINSEHLCQMKDKNIAWVPTVSPIGNILKYPTGRYSNQEIITLEQILEAHLIKIREAFRLGVHLGVGTDAGAYRVPHADSFFDEMAWLCEAGIPEEEVKRIATKGNASILGLSDFGCLRVGTGMSHLQLV